MINIPLTSNKDPQNVANRLKDAGKLLKVHFMFKLKVELEVCSVCYIIDKLLTKIWKYYTFKMLKYPPFDHALDEKSFPFYFDCH